MTRRSVVHEIRLEAAGYQSPGQRDGCRKCTHGGMWTTTVAGTDYVKKDHYCRKLRCSVAGGGWCPGFAPAVALRRVA